MPTLTISMPQELLKRLDEHKATFNVSRLCQEAIDSELVKLEALKGRKGTEMTMVKRLNADLESETTAIFDEAFKDGIVEAEKNLSLSTLRRFNDAVIEHERSGTSVEDVFHETIRSEEYDDEIRPGRRFEADIPEFMTAYAQGFVRGANEKFQAVKSDLGG